MDSYFYEDATYAALFKEMVSIKHWKVIKIFWVIIEKVDSLFPGAHPNDQYTVFGARMFIFTDHRTKMDKYWILIKIREAVRKPEGRTMYRETDRVPKTISSNSGWMITCKYVKTFVSIFYDYSTSLLKAQ
jgi:hypothetical protein